MFLCFSQNRQRHKDLSVLEMEADEEEAKVKVPEAHPHRLPSLGCCCDQEVTQSWVWLPGASN